MNIAQTIIPKSTQLNSDDLIAGPRTIRITAVETGSAEQPVAIRYDGDDKRPYLPSKSMRRVLVVLWGGNGDVYVGRRLTLYRDPEVKFGGEVVGGIKISHASHIDGAQSISLTVTRGKKKPHRVEPLTIDAPNPLDNLPEGWGEWSNEERGENRANLGTAALVAWWETLTPAEKKPLESKKNNDWKPTAAKKGGAS